MCEGDPKSIQVIVFGTEIWVCHKNPLSKLDQPCPSKACICVSRAGRPAAGMQHLALAQAQECCVCCLNSGLSHCRSGGGEGRKWLHVYIAELSFSPPQCLMHFCSNIYKCAR